MLCTVEDGALRGASGRKSPDSGKRSDDECEEIEPDGKEEESVRCQLRLIQHPIQE